MPQPTHLAALAVATEDTPGTPADSGWAWIPWKTLTPKDTVGNQTDEGVRGAPVDAYGIVQGKKSSSLDLAGDLFPDTFGHILAGLLSDVTTTGASAPYTHTFSLLCSGDTQGVSKTYLISDPNLGAWAYPGVRLSEIGLKWNADGLLNWSAKGDGWAYNVLEDGPTPSFGSLKPYATWAIVTSLAGTPIPVLDGELTISRKSTTIQAADGTQGPVSIWGGDVSVSGKLTVLMDDSTQRDVFQASTVQSFSVAATAGTGAALTGLTVTCSQIYYDDATPSPGGDYWEIPISFKAIANTTDRGAAGYSPVKVTLKNALTSGSYTT